MASLSLLTPSATPGPVTAPGQPPSALGGVESETAFSQMVLQAGLNPVQGETVLPAAQPGTEQPVALLNTPTPEMPATETAAVSDITNPSTDLVADLEAGQTTEAKADAASLDAAPSVAAPVRPQFPALTPSALQALSVMQEQNSDTGMTGMTKSRPPEGVTGASMADRSGIPVSRVSGPEALPSPAPEMTQAILSAALTGEREKMSAPISKETLTAKPLTAGLSQDDLENAPVPKETTPSLTAPQGISLGILAAKPRAEPAMRDLQDSQIGPAPAMATPRSGQIDAIPAASRTSPHPAFRGLPGAALSADAPSLPVSGGKAEGMARVSVPGREEPAVEAELAGDSVKVLSVAKPSSEGATWRPAAAAARMAGATLMAAPELVPLTRSAGHVPSVRPATDPRGGKDAAAPLFPATAEPGRTSLGRALPAALPVAPAASPATPQQQDTGVDHAGHTILKEQDFETFAPIASGKHPGSREEAQVGKLADRVSEAASLASAGQSTSMDLVGTAGTELRPEFALSAHKEVGSIFPAAAPSPLPQAHQASLPQALAQQISRHLQAGDITDGTTRISFTDEAVGEVVIEMGTDDAGQMRILLKAENPGLLHVLRTDRDSLIQNLNQAGVSVNDRSLGFEDLGQRGRDGRNAQNGSPQPKADGPAKLDLEPITPSRSGPVRLSAEPGRLDILT